MNEYPLELLIERLQSIESRLAAHGQEVRNAVAAVSIEMRQGFADMGRQIDAHTREDREVEARVVALERNEEERDSSATKRGALMSALIAPACIAAWEVIKHIGGWR